MGKIIRPQVDEDLVRQVRVKFPAETAGLTNAETLAWVLKRLIKGAKA